MAPHSPKNCLPGSGWAAMSSGVENTRDPRPRDLDCQPVRCGPGRRKNNRLLLVPERLPGHRQREYWAKIWLVLDSIRYRRSDTSLVRVVVPTVAGKSTEETDAIARDFLRTSYPYIREQFLH